MRREGPANPYSGSSVWFRGLMTSVAEPRLELETFIVRAVSTSHSQVSSFSFLKKISRGSEPFVTSVTRLFGTRHQLQRGLHEHRVTSHSYHKSWFGRVRFSVVSQPRGTHSYQSHPRSQTLSRKATNDRFCVLLEEDVRNPFAAHSVIRQE